MTTPDPVGDVSDALLHRIERAFLADYRKHGAIHNTRWARLALREIADWIEERAAPGEWRDHPETVLVTRLGLAARLRDEAEKDTGRLEQCSQCGLMVGLVHLCEGR